MWESIRINGIIHLIERISLMQMFSFNFGFWFGFKSSFPFGISPEIHLISIRNQSRDTFIVIKLNTYTLEKSVWESIRFCGIIRLIGHISMMQMISFISVFWFGFRSLFSFWNQSRDSFIIIKLNTLHSWKEHVRVNSI